MAETTVTKNPADPFIIKHVWGRLTPEQQKTVSGLAASMAVANERQRELAKGGAA